MLWLQIVFVAFLWFTVLYLAIFRVPSGPNWEYWYPTDWTWAVRRFAVI